MALSNEWTEYHLTARGWERGSERDDHSGITHREPPSDRVQTWRWTDSAQYNDSTDEVDFDNGGIVLWSSDDEARIAELRAQYGEPPRSL